MPPFWNTHTLSQATNGIWYIPPHYNMVDFCSAKIVTNSKNIQAGDVFLALKGERFDAHHFVADVANLGASAVIVQQLTENMPIPQLLVADTRLALGHLGTFFRAQFSTLQVAALTGSSGKTTTKEMLGSILNSIAPTLTTRGNLNNDLGVPMMLLELNSTHQFAVMELGANHIGEIDYTTHLVNPIVAGVLNIGTAHVGEFGGRIGIAKTKAEIFHALPAHGTAIIPANGDFVEILIEAAKPFKTIRFGAGGDVFASHIVVGASNSQFTLNTPQGTADICLPLAGAHNIDNALAASAFALALNAPLANIVQGLNNAPSTKGRLVFHHASAHGNAITLIDDTYNANPHSMRAAAAVLAKQTGYKLMVIGDMAELGDDAANEHFSLGADLRHAGLDAVIAVGAYAQHIVAGLESTSSPSQATSASLSNTPLSTAPVTAQAFANKADALPTILNSLTLPNASTIHAIAILFKGSRSAAIETLLNALLEKKSPC